MTVISGCQPNSPTEMKLIITTLSGLSLGFLLPVTAQVTETKTETEITKNPDGSVTESTTTTVSHIAD